jgi:predicted dithiol-disulfide oxidoreductase (DUF899 family)
MNQPRVVSRDAWLAARRKFLLSEKEFTRQRDALNAERRKLPMVAIDKEYFFDGPDGKVRLLDLFDHRRQLIIYHFMFDPAWDEGCPRCSFVADNFGHLAHLHARDTSFAVISRAPLAKLEAFRKRMGWSFPWYSSLGSDFNYDFHVTTDEAVMPVEYNYKDKAALEQARHTYHVKGEQPGVSVFLRVGDNVFHTYSAYARGLDLLCNTYNYLDLTPLGRQEGWDETGDLTQEGQFWTRHHDRYGG